MQNQLSFDQGDRQGTVLTSIADHPRRLGGVPAGGFRSSTRAGILRVEAVRIRVPTGTLATKFALSAAGVDDQPGVQGDQDVVEGAVVGRDHHHDHACGFMLWTSGDDLLSVSTAS